MNLPQLVEGVRVLDVGCGQGWALFEAARQGAQTVGLDLSTELLYRAREHSSRLVLPCPPIFALGRADTIPLPSATFDAIFCTELIEHTTETATTLGEIQRLLKPGALLFLSFPVKRVENIITRFSSAFFAYSGHVKQFTLNEMTNQLAANRFKVLHVNGKYFEWSVYWLFRAVLGQIPTYDRRNERYGVEAPQDAKWQTFDSYYKRIWARAIRWKVGLPVLWLGNRVFPKNYVLICQKAS